MTQIIKEMDKKMWKVLYTNLNYLRLNAEDFDSDKLFTFTKALAYKLMELNKESEQNVKLIEFAKMMVQCHVDYEESVKELEQILGEEI